MKKLTSGLLIAFTTAIFAGSAMASTPAQHATEKTSTVQMSKQHGSATHKHAGHKNLSQKSHEHTMTAAKSSEEKTLAKK